MFKAKRFPKPVFYIYALICPIYEEIKYIGLTKNPKTRLYQHLNACSENKRKNEWIKKLKDLNLEPKFEILDSFTDRLIASNTEVRYIEENKNTLLNGKYTVKYPEFAGKYSYEGMYDVNMTMTKDTLKKLEFIVSESRRSFKMYRNCENTISSLINEKYNLIISKSKK